MASRRPDANTWSEKPASGPASRRRLR
jgi:hypothetical protein